MKRKEMEMEKLAFNDEALNGGELNRGEVGPIRFQLNQSPRKGVLKEEGNPQSLLQLHRAQTLWVLDGLPFIASDLKVLLNEIIGNESIPFFSTKSIKK